MQVLSSIIIILILTCQLVKITQQVCRQLIVIFDHITVVPSPACRHIIVFYQLAVIPGSLSFINGRQTCLISLSQT